jgi:hypothetical protein
MIKKKKYSQTPLHTTEMLHPFLHDLQGTLLSPDAFHAAWDENQSIVEDFMENYPKFKDRSGLYGTTILYSAAGNNYFNLFKYLNVGKVSSIFEYFLSGFVSQIVLVL